VAEPALPTVTIRRRGAEVQITGHMKTDIAAMNTVVTKTMASSRASAKIAQSLTNLKLFAIAMHSYNDQHGRLPPAVVTSKDGKPLYSWRVLLLPYLDPKGEDLYKEFNLEEPWDSEHNKTLLAKMPPVFTVPGVKTKEPYSTFYQVFTGKEAIFWDGEVRKIPDAFKDGTSNTLLVVEAGEAVPWTKPVDLPYAPDKPLPKLGGLFPELPAFYVTMGDGSTRAIPRKIRERTLRALITPAGGERIEDF
jgi:hypothetical protein